MSYWGVGDKINLGHSFSVVDNEFASPTNASDLAKVILDKIKRALFLLRN